MKKSSLICLLYLSSLQSWAASDDTPILPFVDVDVAVVDMDNVPISNALVRVAFTDWDRNEIKEEAASGESGIVTFTKRTAPRLFVRVTHESYYSDAAEHMLDGDIINNEVVYPTNHVQKLFRLRLIKNPVPMYVKSVDLKLPEKGDSIGFDFMAGDWVTPHGKGKVGDIKFTTSGYLHRYDDYSTRLQIEFPNEGDGLMLIDIPRKDHAERYEFRLDYEAPPSGYVGYYELSSAKSPDKPREVNMPKESANYYFRIRTKKDEDGNVVSALYGKIHNPINYSFSKKKKSVRFYYYLNPDGTRNMESDPSTNLFPNGSIGFNP
jgi:hypothetical protein